MLSLRSATDEAWLARALAHLDEILLDHAHCEKKAASSAVSLLFKYAEREELLAPLSRLAREELAHFEEVLAVLTAPGIPVRPPVASPYAAEVLRAVRTQEPERLLRTPPLPALPQGRNWHPTPA